ncbi:MAG: FGGY family carbohydrate kinase [Armatimonadota bacterium]|jgi:xylulokinase
MTSPRPADLVLAIDAGTTLIKAAVFSLDGVCLGAGQAKQPISSPQPGWAEQDPLSWWRGARAAARRAIGAAGIGGERIAAVGISTQGGTVAIFDEAGKPCGPALGWNDARQRAPLESLTSSDAHFAATRLAHLNMSPTALAWLKAARPEWFSGRYRIGYVPDYLTFRMTGNWVTDPTNLAISNLCDLAAADIAQCVLETLGLPRSAFADTRQAGEAAGMLSPSASRALGVRAGIPVAAPAHDQYAGALGAGCVSAGDILLSAGTAWVILLVTDRPVIDRTSSFWPARHVQRGLWGLLGSVASGGSTLNKVLEFTKQRADWDHVNRAAAAVPVGSDGLLVVPHLTGRTIPSWDTGAAGAVLGWSLGHTREHLWRAAMEGLAFEVRAACDYLRERGVSIASLRMVGGGAKSDLIPPILASALGVPVYTNAASDVAVRGAACLAARCLGLHDLPKSTGRREHRPVAAWRGIYDEAYDRYREAIRRLESRS